MEIYNVIRTGFSGFRQRSFERLDPRKRKLYYFGLRRGQVNNWNLTPKKLPFLIQTRKNIEITVIYHQQTIYEVLSTYLLTLDQPIRTVR